MHYFAYGSNLHPLRLRERVPSARLVGAVALDRHSLVFHKRSHDGSGKCNLLRTDLASDCVHGAVYDIAAEHKSDLDHYEGCGSGYLDASIRLRCREREYHCFTYFAQQSHIADQLQPYHWYKQLVLLGARFLHFPRHYIASIESVASMPDPDADRSRQGDDLIARILDYRGK